MIIYKESLLFYVLGVSHWNPSDRNSLQVPRTLLSILNNAVV